MQSRSGVASRPINAIVRYDDGRVTKKLGKRWVRPGEGHFDGGIAGQLDNAGCQGALDDLATLASSIPMRDIQSICVEGVNKFGSGLASELMILAVPYFQL